MDTQSNKNLSILMLLAGMLLIGFSMGHWLAPLAAWIGPVLIMRYYRDQKAGRGFLLVFTAYIPAFLIGFGGIWSAMIPILIIIPILAIFYALLWSLPYLADRLLSQRIKGFSSTFVYPLAAATLELVNIHVNPVGMWGATGFTQYGNLALMQLASVTGMIGITFLMGWAASVANWAWENRGSMTEVRRGLGVFGAVLGVVLIFGFARLNLSHSHDIEKTVRVAGIIGESQDIVYERVSEISDPAAARIDVLSHWEAYFSQTVREAQAGAKIIIWPEGAGLSFSPEETSSLISRAQEVARNNNVYLAIGLGLYYEGPIMEPPNKLLLIDPTGEIVMDHSKYGFMFQYGGNKILQAVDTPFGVVSGVICWDLDFPAVIQQAGRNGTGLFLVPGNDWIEIDPIHSQMGVFRAIENGMSIVRLADHSLSMTVDPYGRILAQTDSFSSTDKMMIAQVPTKHVATFYTAFGHWLEWLAPIGLLYFTFRSWSLSRQRA